jgi:UDP-GlcNAc:undecaprenyl-phosphate GlcNAc-1-phosphate transferase
MIGPEFALVLAGGACGLAAASGLTMLMLRLSPRLGYVDRPGGHKSHRAPTPYGGGVAIFWAICLPTACALLIAHFAPAAWLAGTFGQPVADYVGGVGERLWQTLIVLLGAGALHALGLVDDVRPLPPGVKLPVMLGVAVLTAWAGEVRLAEFAGRGASIALSGLWIVVITNAFNFLDNMDGLSAGVGAICLALLVACGLAAGQVLIPAWACLMLGAVLGFLVFNFPPARIFMGDAGSLVVGYTIAVVSILTTYFDSGEGRAPYPLVMPLVVLAVPLYDFVTVVAIRLREGRNPLFGDQRHFSHRLVEHGLSRRQAVLTIYLATLATGLTATLLPMASLRETVTVAGIVLMVLAIIAILETPPRKDAG